MDDQFRQEVIKVLKRGDELPTEWARELFPPEKREYELIYHGKERKEDILADTMAVPFQPVRTFGKNGNDWHSKLIFGDNLQAMKTLRSMKEQGQLANSDGTPGVRLIYIDPPFATRKEFAGSQDQKAYNDKIIGARFVEFLRKRLVMMKELLSPDGSIYVHLDEKKSHYIKVVMDEIFGEHHFQREIVWRIGWLSGFKTQAKNWIRNHDILLFYTPGPKFIFNKTYIPYPEDYVRRDGSAPNGKGYPLEDTWNCYNIDKLDSIQIMSFSGEKTGFPTQKNEHLLERIIRASSNTGDIVLDAFAGSGTTLAVAEKTGRRWIGIDSSKLAIYTIQKRMLNLRDGIGNTGRSLNPKPFTLYNAGLYDFSNLKDLPWDDWRFFALQLFNCRDERHTIGGLQLDGKLKGASVLVFDHTKQPGKRIDEETVYDIHAAVGSRIGGKFFIIAPRGVFDFQQDYLDIDGVRYYALRIPYSVIDELHRRKFTGLQQPSDELAVNDTVEAVGFDFIRPPEVEFKVTAMKPRGELLKRAQLKITGFDTRAWIRGRDTRSGLEALSMLMLDFDYDGNVFDLDKVFYANQLEGQGWMATFPLEDLGEKIMTVFVDIYGNESSVVIPREDFIVRTTKKAKANKASKTSTRKKTAKSRKTSKKTTKVKRRKKAEV